MSPRLRRSLVLAVLSALTLAASPLPYIRPLGTQGVPGRLFPKPDRPVADIVAPAWGDERQRDLANETQQLTSKLGIKPGQVVADIGAGAGYDSLRLARVVGPKGKVIAQDIRPEYLAGLVRAVKSQKLGNVEPALGQSDDPRLKQGSVDVAIMIHMYHEITSPYALLYNLAPALRPGGRVGVMEANRASNQHGTPPELLKCEFEAVGYREMSRTEMDGGLGYLSVFAPPRPEQRPRPEQIKPCRAGRQT